MKDVRGMVKVIDRCGRISIPIEYRELHSITQGSLLEMKICDGNIELSPISEPHSGFARALENNGRFTLPSNFRRTLGICSSDKVDVYVKGDALVIRKID